jgi:hypothetical protein
MMTPCFKVFVRKIENTKITLQVNYFNLSGFDYDNKRTILRLLAFGVHCFDKNGKYERFRISDFEKEISFENLWDNVWIAEYAKKFYKTAKCIDELTYLSYLYLEKLPENIYDFENGNFEKEKAFFENKNLPNCLIEIEVTKIEYLNRFEEGMSFEVY